MAEPRSRLRRWLGLALLAWILGTAQWADARDPATGAVTTAGLAGALGRAHLGWLSVAAGFYGAATLAGVVRFWALLRVHGTGIPLRFAFQLTYVGLFFNLLLPGATGGDMVKIAWASRATGGLAGAVGATGVDRVIGVLCLSLVALVPTLFVLGDPAYRRVAVVCVAVLALAFGILALYLLPPMRRLFERIGGTGGRAGAALARMDLAVSGYRRQPRAVLMASGASIAAQLALVASLWALGRALALPPVNYVVVAPAIMLASAVPVVPGGVGQAEAAFVHFMPLPPAEAPRVIALGLCYRLLVLGFACLGGLVLIAVRRGTPRPVDGAPAAPDSAAG